MDFRLIGLVVCSIVQFIVLIEAGIQCYQCDLLPHQRDCDKVVQCGEHEVCYGERRVTTDGIVVFRSGCKSKQACLGMTSPVGNGLGRRMLASSSSLDKRQNLIPCSQCCDTSYCNREICDVPVQSYGMRCLSCQYALNPQSCFVSVQCNTDEICYSQTIIHNHEKRFRLGCVSKQHCSNGQIDTLHQPLGRRQTLDANATDEYCGQCCSGENCNREVCSSSGSQTMTLIQPPSLSICRDNSTALCRANIHRCSEDYFKFYQCPYTCGTCGGTQVVGGSGTTQVAGDCTGPFFHKWNNMCYWRSSVQTIWKDDVCQQNQMLPAILDQPGATSELATFLNSLQNGSEKVWIGGYFNRDHHIWAWLDGTSISVNNPDWLSEQRDHVRGINCMAVLPGGGSWSKDFCTHHHFHLCMRHLHIPIVTTATPSKTTTGPHGNYYSFGGHTYFLDKEKRRDFSSSHCGHGFQKAIINSDEEQVAITHFIRDILKLQEDVWLGGQHDMTHGWRWVNHEPINSQNHLWAHHEPVQHGCLVLHGEKWKSRDCNELFYRLCESK